MSDYRSLSLWLDTVPGDLEPRPCLTGEPRVDVAIVGAGYTGLWTAYYLKQLEPGCRIALLEAEVAGFGASGRNGGWCIAALAGLRRWLIDPDKRAAGLALQRALFDAVDEVGRVAEREAIDCHYRKSGAIRVATSRPQLERMREELAFSRLLGFEEDDQRWLEPGECTARIRLEGALGGTYTPHAARLHPARLVRGLASAVERQGISLYERSPALGLAPGRVRTPGGSLRADLVVRATEAYTSRLPGLRRHTTPIHSMMVATEPLPAPVWKEIGLEEYELFGDGRRIITYGQRTADDRIAFGTRGEYRFGSGIRDRFPADAPDFERVRGVLVGLLPALAGVRITHRWGGALAVPRDWTASVGLDRDRGLAWAGGYVGDGVAATNLAGRTLADLIVGRETERTALPWVGHRSPGWEPEPLRWLGVRALRWLAEVADRSEARRGRETRLAGPLFDRFAGH